MDKQEDQGRLMIEKVVLENFKSYAGVKEIGPFHKSFTAVVGPNGSGKSNLLEALLFAFGKSARKMRLRKLKDLIHTSSKYPDLRFCRVSVHFANIIDYGEDFEVVPGSELVLTRRVTKDSKATYKINDLDSSYEEATSLLKLRGVDLVHNRFLILQGEVEQIAMMKPRAPEENKVGLLEYLEEIIGTNVYVPMIKEAEEELEKIAETVAMQRNRLEQSEKQLSELEAPKNQALEYMKLEENTHQIKNLRFQVQKGKVVQILEKLMVEIDNDTETSRSLGDTFKIKLEENKEILDLYSHKKDELDEIYSNIKNLKILIQENMNKETALTGELKSLKARINETAENIDKQTRREKDLSDKLEAIEKEHPALKEALVKLEEEKEVVDATFSELNAQVLESTLTLQNQRNEIEKELIPFNNQLHDVKSKLDITRRKIEDLTSTEEKRATELQNAHEKLNNVRQKIETDKEDHENYHREVLNIAEQRKNNDTEFYDIQQQYDKLKNEIEHDQALKQDLEREERSAEGQSKLMQEIMTAVRVGEIDGVYGRLGDLAQINPKYDVAVSVAAPRLDYLLVATTEHANRVLDYVRRKRLGKVNILALDKITNMWGEKARKPFNANAPRLFDLVKPTDRRYIPAFYFVLMDTLVANSLEEARKLAFDSKKRMKVVTLKGDVVHPSGEMQGFARPTGGKMRLEGSSMRESSSTSLQEIEVLIERKMQALTKLKTSLMQVQAQAIEFRKQEDGLSHRLALLDEEISASNAEIRSLEDKLTRLQHSERGKIGELTEIEQKQTQAFNKAQALVNAKTQMLAEVDRQIEEAGGNEFRMTKQRRAVLIEDISEHEEKLIKIENQKKQWSKDMEKSRKLRENLTKDMETKQKQIEQCRAEKQALFEPSKAILEEYQNLEGEKAARIKKMKQMEEEQDKLKKEFEEMNTAKKALDELIKEKKESVKAYKHEKIKWEKRIAENRKDLQNLKHEYMDILGDCMEIDEEPDDVFDEEHQIKRSKRGIQSSEFLFDTGKDFSQTEILPYLDRLETIEQYQKEVEEELLKSRPDMGAIKNYRERLIDKNTRDQELKESKEQENEMRKGINSLTAKRLNEFTVGFTAISEKLREMYRMITRGGDAELEFADSTDPFSEGIIFTVRPPKKSWKKMANLSGGEKTLSSLALVFALHHYKPNALYVMDEVDAALDYQNVSVIANYIKARTKNAQFVVVSLRYQMFELADRLVGVYKTHDDSKTLAISPCSLRGVETNNPIINQTVRNISVENM